MEIKPFFATISHQPSETAATGIISIHEESHMKIHCEIFAINNGHCGCLLVCLWDLAETVQQLTVHS